MIAKNKRFERMLGTFRTLRISNCVKRTAKELQRAIRIENSDENGFCECVTCGKIGHYKDMHAGHFVGSRRNAVLFEERNIHVQCNYCNTYLSGNQEAYSRYMLERYGKDVVDSLLRLRNEVVAYSREELVEKRISYMDRVKAAMKQRSL